jgi:hypothetical protein
MTLGIASNRLAVVSTATLILAAGCIDPSSPLIEDSTEGCAELRSGGDLEALDVHPRVRELMAASLDFHDVVTAMKGDVLTACANVARDLGAEDSWSALGSGNDAISNSNGTGACDRAGQKIEALLDAAGPIDIAVAVSKGECHLNFDEQRQCDQQCAVNQTCEPGTIETRCEPGSLSVVCSGSCSAEATCVGKPERAANCMGKCESECVGECHGTCVHADGHKTDNDPNCNGKCSSTCNGTCRGLCKIEQPEGVNCGADVHCTGGCTSSFTDPVCVSTFTPPACQLDEQCHDVCTTRVEAHAVCDPTQIQVFVDLTTHPELQPLADTLEQNLPKLIDAAEKQGKLALDALRRLGSAGSALRGNVDDLNGKSLACTAETSTLLAETLDTGEITFDAAVRVEVIVDERCE